MSAESSSLPMYVAALVAYDGTEYFGFQVQKDVPTIQGTLEHCLCTFTTLEGRIVGSGRTDTGVHARGQVIGLRVHWRHDLSALQRAWNAHLPSAIAVRAVQSAPTDFHPRFSAVSRTYRYFVSDPCLPGWQAPRRSPLLHRYAHVERRQLDVAAMQQVADLFVGEHDFATFGQPPQGVNTVRRVLQAVWQVVGTTLLPLGGQSERTLVFTITANAFLQHMVRNLVGAMLAVGRGERSVGDVKTRLDMCNRSSALRPAPANGLVLECVDYPDALGITLTRPIDESSYFGDDAIEILTGKKE